MSESSGTSLAVPDKQFAILLFQSGNKVESQREGGLLLRAQVCQKRVNGLENRRLVDTTPFWWRTVLAKKKAQDITIYRHASSLSVAYTLKIL